MSIEDSLPAHNVSLTIEHNPCREYYKTVYEWLDEIGIYEWLDSESLQRSIDTNEIWVMKWYSETPPGFFAIAAPTLAELLELSQEVEQ